MEIVDIFCMLWLPIRPPGTQPNYCLFLLQPRKTESKHLVDNKEDTLYIQHDYWSLSYHSWLICLRFLSFDFNQMLWALKFRAIDVFRSLKVKCMQKTNQTSYKISRHGFLDKRLRYPARCSSPPSDHFLLDRRQFCEICTFGNHSLYSKRLKSLKSFFQSFCYFWTTRGNSLSCF